METKHRILSNLSFIKFESKCSNNLDDHVCKSRYKTQVSLNGSRPSSFIGRNVKVGAAKRNPKSGGIASLVSPYLVTPAVLPTPKFSPAREVLADVAKEEWGVDGYGLIRVRSPDNEPDEGVIVSWDNDVEEVEKRLSHDLSRFEMIYDPRNDGSGSGRDGMVLVVELMTWRNI
ncbi:hypothetical protein RND71_001486 [Anisodus tanguticus]|uniref:Uncharacterized protein n=1 Tax=Anisodus tanguticus TaxID=243964 RepID=A0AAE1T110_9SOLA|nr:hypothetical protein RND71_001486 [Anisodus tanguticus]